jgi:hypothetical protein
LRRSFGTTEIEGEGRLLEDPHIAEMSKEEGGGENDFLHPPIISSLNPNSPFSL